MNASDINSSTVLILCALLIGFIIYHKNAMSKQKALILKDSEIKVKTAIEQERIDAHHAVLESRTEGIIARVGQCYFTCTNKWEDPIIGVLTSYRYDATDDDVYPVMRDYISGSELVCKQPLLAYTGTSLKVFLSMDPYERWLFVFAPDIEDSSFVFDIGRYNAISTIEQLTKKLVDENFLSAIHVTDNRSIGFKGILE